LYYAEIKTYLNAVDGVGHTLTTLNGSFQFFDNGNLIIFLLIP